MADQNSPYYLLAVDNPNGFARQWEGRSYRVWANTPAARAESRLIVVHIAAAPPDVSGGDTKAEDVVRWQSGTTYIGSYHTVVDSDSTVRCLPPSWVAYGAAGWNAVAVHVSFASMPDTWDLYPGWVDGALPRAAAEVACWCRDLDIPARHLTSGEIAMGDAGIAGHADLDPVDRPVDPGPAFPWDRFIALVEAELGGSPPPVDPPVDPPIDPPVDPPIDPTAALMEEAVTIVHARIRPDQFEGAQVHALDWCPADRERVGAQQIVRSQVWIGYAVPQAPVWVRVFKTGVQAGTPVGRVDGDMVPPEGRIYPVDVAGRWDVVGPPGVDLVVWRREVVVAG